MPESVAGHVVGYFPDSRMLYAEGHPSEDGLAPADPEFLAGVVTSISDELADHGLQTPRNESAFDRSGSPGLAGVRRLDITLDVERPASTGRAVLAGVAAIRPPGHLKSVTTRAGGSIETIAWRGKRSMAARVYDKGVESGSHDRGERVRFEDQRRFSAAGRPTVSMLNETIVSDMFQRRFSPLLKASEGLTVTGITRATERVREAVAQGEITAGQGIDVIGYLVMEAQGGAVGHRQTQWRHRHLAEGLGLVITEGGLEEVDVNLHRELSSAIGTWVSD